MHFSKGLFSTYTGRKCILFSQEVPKIVLLGPGSRLQKCCCYKKIFLWCFSFPSEDNTFFMFFTISKDVCLSFPHSHGQTIKSLFFRILVGPECLNVCSFNSKQRALSGSLTKQNLLVSKKEHCLSFFCPILYLEVTTSSREESLQTLAMLPQPGKNCSAAI